MAPDVIHDVQMPIRQQNKGAMHIDAKTGKLVDATEARRVASFALPALFVTLMLLVVILAAVPAMQGVVEEKQQRIAEVLLGCISPFELMLGKLLGVVAISLTISSVYIAGAAFLAGTFGLAGLISPALIVWFVDLLDPRDPDVRLALHGRRRGGERSEGDAVLADAGDDADHPPGDAPRHDLARAELQARDGGLVHPFFEPDDHDGAPLDVERHPALATAPSLRSACSRPRSAACGRRGASSGMGLLLQGKGVRIADLVKWVVRG